MHTPALPSSPATALLAISAAALLLASHATLDAQTVAVARSGDGLRIEIDGALFTEYATSGTTNPNFYPVIGPDGVGLTREFPAPAGVTVDHPHHHSIWIAHDGVNGVNFWAVGPDAGHVEHTGFTNVKANGASASFTAQAKWLTPQGDVVLNDERRCIITALPEGARQIDLSVTLAANADAVTFRDTKEGTVAIRVAPWLAASGNKYNTQGGRGHILTSAGLADAKAWGTRAKWVSYYGPDPSGQPVCLTMMDHPANLRHPTWWHVRTYGLFAANPFGQHDFEADKEHPHKGD
ncbi:MAG: PmoA family protein, partial [Chthoniobacter sp.]|uniref:DUF6807 domain-containing protein n=1 Tax=Chthoniobacter sp. TaxID=2510640 RepID=UPI0032A1CFE0